MLTLFWLAFPSLLLLAWVWLGVCCYRRGWFPRRSVIDLRAPPPEAEYTRLVADVAQEVLDRLQVEMLLHPTKEEDC